MNENLEKKGLRCSFVTIELFLKNSLPWQLVWLLSRLSIENLQNLLFVGGVPSEEESNLKDVKVFASTSQPKMLRQQEFLDLISAHFPLHPKLPRSPLDNLTWTMKMLCFVSDLDSAAVCPWQPTKSELENFWQCRNVLNSILYRNIYVVQWRKIEHKTINTSGSKLSSQKRERIELCPPSTTYRDTPAEQQNFFMTSMSSGVEINVMRTYMRKKRGSKATTNEMWITNPYIDGNLNHKY